VLAVVKGRQTAALACYPPGSGDATAAVRLIWRTRPGWYHDRELIDLLDTAHQRLAAPIILIWDNLSSHHRTTNTATNLTIKAQSVNVAVRPCPVRLAESRFVDLPDRGPRQVVGE
jgi:hypothetical protein